MRISHFISIFSLCILLSACSNDVIVNSFTPKPNALGKMNEIVVITDQSIWDGMVGDSIRYYLGGEYPVTPRPEPLFDLRHYNPEKLEFEKLLRELRTYLIIANLNDAESETTKLIKADIGEEKFKRALTDPNFTTSVGKNKWATGQVLIYLFANTHDQIAAELRKNFSAIATRVKSHDAEQLASLAYARGENIGLSELIKERYGFEFKIPADYKIAIDDRIKDVIELRKDIKDGVLTISFRNLPYTDTNQLSKAYLKQIRDDIGKERAYSNEPNSFMVVNNIDLPILEYSFDKIGSYGKEFRGIWELENDFMGGPFISYLIINQETNNLLFIDTWVQAPGRNKRNFMQQLELIVKGF